MINISDKKLFLFDIFGVLHEGDKLFDKIEQSLIKYKQKGFVAIATNATTLDYEVEESLLKKGLQKGLHYDKIFSSGDLLVDFLKRNKDKKLKIFTDQNKNSGLYNAMNENAILEKNIEDADYYYISLDCSNPDYNEGKYNLDYLLNKYNASSLYDLMNCQLKREDSLIEINQNLKTKKILCANCDTVAVHKGIVKVVQGFYGLYLQKLGYDVEFFGKPFENIYIKAMNHFKIKPEQAIMFGDQHSTDLIGARNLKISTVLINSKISNLTANFIYSKSSFYTDAINNPDVILDNISNLGNNPFINKF